MSDIAPSPHIPRDESSELEDKRASTIIVSRPTNVDRLGMSIASVQPGDTVKVLGAGYVHAIAHPGTEALTVRQSAMQIGCTYKDEGHPVMGSVDVVLPETLAGFALAAIVEQQRATKSKLVSNAAQIATADNTTLTPYHTTPVGEVVSVRGSHVLIADSRYVSGLLVPNCLDPVGAEYTAHQVPVDDTPTVIHLIKTEEGIDVTGQNPQKGQAVARVVLGPVQRQADGTIMWDRFDTTITALTPEDGSEQTLIVSAGKLIEQVTNTTSPPKTEIKDGHQGIADKPRVVRPNRRIVLQRAPSN